MIDPRLSDSDGAAGGGVWLLNHLPTILWQRRIYILVPFLVVLFGSAIAAYTLPTYYRSNATLLVRSAELPAAIADAPGADIEERIAKIREQVLSRGDLIRLIEQDDLYPEDRRSNSMSYVVDKMRRATTVGALASDIGQTGTTKDNTIALSLSFDYPDPGKAQAVMQEYVNQFLRKDSDESQDQADVAVRFLQDEAAKLQTQIQDIESRVTALKAQNGAALAGGSMPLVMDTGSYTAQIADLENQNRQLLAQTEHSDNSELAQAEAALAKAQAVFSDNHPDVIQARERVRELRQAAAKADPNSSIQQQVQANNTAIASLKQSRDAAIAKENAAFAGQARAPAILEQASQLENQANALRDQYKQVADNLLKAEASARLADEQRGERLSLVDPANFPDHPQWPNRPLLIAAGAAAGIVLGIFLALGIELLNQPLRSPGQIEGMGLPVLGLVPIFQSPPHKRGLWLWGRREKSIA
jgi:uncharacterized protein involved in exopolysaccharide biosynthesis